MSIRPIWVETSPSPEPGGYLNQAFYIWIQNESDVTVSGPEDPGVDEPPLSGTLTPGTYTIYASCKSGNSAYAWSDEYSGYVLSVTDEDLTYTVSDYAESLGIPLSTTKRKAMPWLMLLLSE